jgi:hypothetical protein
MSAFLVASIARFLEADIGGDTEREQLLFAVDPVAETPVLLPVLLDPEIEASGVGHFPNTQPETGRIPAFPIGQHRGLLHGGNSRRHQKVTTTLTTAEPRISRDTSGMPWTDISSDTCFIDVLWKSLELVGR